MPGKKKGKGKKPKKQENRTDILNEVDKTFYELQITDLNRKLARLKLTSQELEDKNQTLENKLVNLDEDRADVISYLKRTLTTKQSESLELQERVTALQETKESEGKEYEEKFEELQLENKTMREQLTSEIKLLTGKLNALEEFRMARDDLMEKFEQQEKIIQDQEMKEKKVIYDIEKKFIISKKNIATEMEKQLFKLANDFEKANEIRIAATTQRCIRENIALNNELNKMLSTLENLNNQVEDYKTQNIELKLNCELYQAERNKKINELQVVRCHLDQMTKDYQARVKILRTYEAELKKRLKADDEMKLALERETVLAAKVRVLEQNLHATRSKEMDLKQLIHKQKQLVAHFQQINREAVIAIEDCLKISLHPRLDEAGKQYRRELLLQNLLTILTQPKIDTHAVLSMDTIDSIDLKYKRGDLGFLPKEVYFVKPNTEKQVLNEETQVTPRYDDCVTFYSPVCSRGVSNGSQSSHSSDDSTNVFGMYSTADIDSRNRTLFSSMVFPGKFISEMQIDNMLSSSYLIDSSLTKSSSHSVSKEDNRVVGEAEGEMYSEDLVENKSVTEKVEEEIKQEQTEEVQEEKDFENTVFGSDNDLESTISSDD